jgi:hypothetical protein
MAKFIFFVYLLTGQASRMERVDNRPTYNMQINDSLYIENAYKGEIVNWIKTGTFVYDETLKD